MHRIVGMIILVVFFVSCQSGEKEQSGQPTVYGDYPVQPVNIRNVKLSDDFWLPIIRRVQEKTIEYALEKCEEEGRFENFLIAGGELAGETRGFMHRVEDDRDKTAIEYGPIVYAFEEIDNPNMERISITGNEEYEVTYQENLLQGVNVLTAKGSNGEFTGIPYYTWSNRGIGKMKVWLPKG